MSGLAEWLEARGTSPALRAVCLEAERLHDMDDGQGPGLPGWAEYAAQRSGIAPANRAMAARTAAALLAEWDRQREAARRAAQPAETPAEAAAREARVAAWRDSQQADREQGRAGDLADLARLAPDHVLARESYTEHGDGGWAGGGPDGWSGGTTYMARTRAGEAAILAVRAGARPRPAMEAALAAETARLEAEGRARAEADAVARADIAARDALEAAGVAAIRQVRETVRALPDSSGRNPWTRRASATATADAEAGEAVLAAVLAIDCPTLAAREMRDREAAQIREHIAARRERAERAARWEGICAAGDASTPDDIRALLASGWLMPREVDDWEDRLARAEAAPAAPVEDPRWGALSALRWPDGTNSAPESRG